jgi:carbon storage regulator CsrA
MLVLSRKKNETILIDGRIKVEVLNIKGNTIKLGITAPSEVKVLRGELSPHTVDVQLPASSTAKSANKSAANQKSQTADLAAVVTEERFIYQPEHRRSAELAVGTDDFSRLPNPFAVVST